MLRCRPWRRGCERRADCVAGLGRSSETTADADVVMVGGIGGITAALALARAGRSVRVLERSGDLTEIGAGLQPAPNATRLLRAGAGGAAAAPA